MGNVTIDRPRVWASNPILRFLMGDSDAPAAPKTVPDAELLEAAVDELGIVRPVRVTPFFHFPWEDSLGVTTLADDGTWEVYVRAMLEETPTKDESKTFSRVLWHELGHAADLEGRARVAGKPIRQVINELLQDRQRIAIAHPMNNDWDGFYEAYTKLPDELAAEAIADRFDGRLLSRRF